MDIVEFQAVFSAPVRNGIYKAKEFQGRGVRLVKMNQLFSERRLHSQAHGYELIELTEKERQTLLLKKNDLLFSRTSVVADGVGKCSIIAEVNEELTWDSNIIRVRLNPEKAYPQFYFYFFNSPDGRDVVKRLSSGAAITTITGSGLATSHVPLPPLPAQQRIAGILSAYDELIENNQQRIRILEDMARSLYREWFVHFRYPGHESAPLVDSPLGQIPQGWEVKTVADSFEIIGGGTPARKEPEYWDDGTIQWFSPSDLTGAGTMFMDDSGERISERGLAKSSARLFPVRSVMLTSRATIGAIAINSNEACTNQGFITCLPNERVPLYFLYHWLKENVPTFQRMASGATFKEISRGVFKTIEFIHPSIELVRSFERTVKPIAGQMRTLQRQTANLRSTRDLLLPRLLSGQVNLATDTPPIYDEDEFKRMVEKGTQAWAGVPDSAAWVETLRGSKE